jgi:hypothetical protein
MRHRLEVGARNLEVLARITALFGRVRGVRVSCCSGPVYPIQNRTGNKRLKSRTLNDESDGESLPICDDGWFLEDLHRQQKETGPRVPVPQTHLI